MFVREDPAIFLHANLSVRLYFIFRNPLNNSFTCIMNVGDHVRCFGIKTCPVSAAANMSLFGRGSAL